MSFVDGYVAPVPTANKETFKAHSTEMAGVFKEHGAMVVVDNWAADVPEGEVTSFPKAVKLEADETVVFGWIVWPSKEVRDAAWAKLQEDERMAGGTMPFDGKRLIYGGFETIVAM